jgi:hypothetical protein
MNAWYLAPGPPWPLSLFLSLEERLAVILTPLSYYSLFDEPQNMKNP